LSFIVTQNTKDFDLTSPLYQFAGGENAVNAHDQLRRTAGSALLNLIRQGLSAMFKAVRTPAL